jgi:hypothetical protein
MERFNTKMLLAMADYRKLLRRHLKAPERKLKFAELGFDKLDETDDVTLYQLGHRIVEDVSNHLTQGKQGYYSYSGVQCFAQHLKAMLNEYELQNDQVVHKSQQASRALLHVIQLVTNSSNKLGIVVRDKMVHSAQIIANYGSAEQRQHFAMALQRFKSIDSHCYNHVTNEIKELWDFSEEMPLASD